MKKAGQVVVFRFPQTDLAEGKLRPALLLGKLPGEYDDWLICMISSQTRHYLAGFDEVVREGDEDFEQSGLKWRVLSELGAWPLYRAIFSWVQLVKFHESV